MTILKVRTAPDPILRQKAQICDPKDPAVIQLAKDLAETMYARDCAGLAANQVGSLKRVVVMDLAYRKEPAQLKHMINPEIIWESDEIVSIEQGCESLPHIRVETPRPERIKVRYTEIDGTVHEEEADEIFALCVQHEIDHLDGILMIDYLSPLKRSLAMKKLKKLKRLTEKEAQLS